MRDPDTFICGKKSSLDRVLASFFVKFPHGVPRYTGNGLELELYMCIRKNVFTYPLSPLSGSACTKAQSRVSRVTKL